MRCPSTSTRHVVVSDDSAVESAERAGAPKVLPLTKRCEHEQAVLFADILRKELRQMRSAAAAAEARWSRLHDGDPDRRCAYRPKYGQNCITGRPSARRQHPGPTPHRRVRGHTDRRRCAQVAVIVARTGTAVMPFQIGRSVCSHATVFLTNRACHACPSDTMAGSARRPAAVRRSTMERTGRTTTCELHRFGTQCLADPLASNLSADYPPSVSEPLAQRLLAGPVCPV